MYPISICAIMKNEEKHLLNFLNSIKACFGEVTNPVKIPYELLILDTGSTDNSVKIAEEFGAKVEHFTWENDFSAARNQMLSLCTNPYVLILDCDEYITDIDVGFLDMFVKQNANSIGLISRRNHYEMNGTDSVYTDDVERFFDKRLYHYEGTIHEQVRPVQDHFQSSCIRIPITVEHVGYNGSAEEQLQKVQRNNELLLAELSKNPDDPYLYFQLGQSYNMIHDDEKAAYYYGKGLEFDLDPKVQYVQMMVIGYGYNLLHLERYEEALSFEGIYDEFATSADFVCLMGLIYLRCGNIMKAMAEFLKATTFKEANTEGANSYIPLFNMGVINEVLGNIKDAKSYYERCGTFPPALARLEELHQS